MGPDQPGPAGQPGPQPLSFIDSKGPGQTGPQPLTSIGCNRMECLIKQEKLYYHALPSITALLPRYYRLLPRYYHLLPPYYRAIKVYYRAIAALLPPMIALHRRLLPSELVCPS